MHKAQIKEREDTENTIGKEQRSRHPRDQHRKDERYRYRSSQEPSPVTIMKQVTLLQRGLRRQPCVQQPVYHVEEPSAQSQSGRQPGRESQTGRPPKGPAPKCCYRGCIQTQEMPIPQQCVRKAKQISV